MKSILSGVLTSKRLLGAGFVGVSTADRIHGTEPDRVYGL
jgi:hypothetical protein